MYFRVKGGIGLTDLVFLIREYNCERNKMEEFPITDGLYYFCVGGQKKQNVN